MGQVSGLNGAATGEVEALATYGDHGLVANKNDPHRTVSIAFSPSPSVVATRTDIGMYATKALTDAKRGRVYVMGAGSDFLGQRLDVFSASGLAAGVTRLGTAVSVLAGQNKFGCSAALCNNGSTLVHSCDYSSDTDEGYLVWDVSSNTPVARYASPSGIRYGQFAHISYPMMGIYNEPYVYYCAYSFGGSPLIPLDLSNPSAPVEGTHQLIPASPYVGGASGVRAAIINKVNSNYLYASYEGGVLHVYDISNRMNPVHLRAIAKTDGTPWGTNVPQQWPTSEQYQQEGGFIVGGAGSGVHVIDVTDPGFPKIYASYTTSAGDQFQGGGGGMSQIALLPNNHFAMSGKNPVNNTPAVAVFKHDFLNLGGWAVGAA